jgi:hypothetical protein
MPHESPTPPARAARGDVIGTSEISAWQTAPGWCWLQTRSPEFARKLSRRSDGQLVARGVAGGYLRTFCFRHSLTWARKLIARYTASETVTSEAKTAPESPVASEREEVRRT